MTCWPCTNPRRGKDILFQLLVLFILATFIVSAPQSSAQCKHEKCQWKLWSHYVEKGCEPVHANNECCPSKFQCPKVDQNQIVKGCHFRGQNYAIGSSLKHSDRCRKCLCRNGGPSPLPQAECMHIECPEDFLPPDANCILRYSGDECCSSNTYCPSDDFSAKKPEPVCHYGNQSYIEGQEIEFEEDPCTVCICHRDFNGPTGPGCKKIDYCFLEDQERLASGCTPVYHPDVCCPIDWICPQDPSLHLDSPSYGDKCVFDGRSYALGSHLPLTKDCISCQCQTPPEFTCIQSTCH